MDLRQTLTEILTVGHRGAHKATQGKLVIFDDSSRNLGRYQHQYSKLGYEVVTVLLANPIFSEARGPDGRPNLNRLDALSRQYPAIAPDPDVIAKIGYIVSDLEQVRSLLSSMDPKPNFILSNWEMREGRAKKAIPDGTYILNTAQQILPNTPRVLHVNPSYRSIEPSFGIDPKDPSPEIGPNSSIQAEDNTPQLQPQTVKPIRAIARSRTSMWDLSTEARNAFASYAMIPKGKTVAPKGKAVAPKDYHDPNPPAHQLFQVIGRLTRNLPQSERPAHGGHRR